MYVTRFFLKSFFLIFLFSCSNQVAAVSNKEKEDKQIMEKEEKSPIIVGAERVERIQKIVGNKRVGVVGNQSSRVGGIHLVDTLLQLGVKVVKVYSPEHGFRGEADAGEKVNSKIDEKTGLPIVSLYGDNKKPTPKQLEGIDILLFDIQSVGVRFYTYISTLHYVMEAAAENKISLVVLDRPNPNGSYVDGPVLEEEFQSFVGMDPLPIVYGMTMGELAKMINGEGWLKNGIKCQLTVVKCQNYKRTMSYSLPVNPSPNLRSEEAIELYPSLCLMEGTILSVGRGTDTPFEVFGHPKLKGKMGYSYSFTPVPNFGSSHPKLENKECFGKNLHSFSDTLKMNKLNLKWLIDAYHALKGEKFFNANWFDLLAGTDKLREQIIAGKSAKEIRDSWQEDLISFKNKRKKYLIYIP